MANNNYNTLPSKPKIINRFKGTKEFMIYCQKYIRGRTLDLGAGRTKYKDIITQSSKEYVAFDMIPGPTIDIVGDIIATGLPDNYFDTVICTQVFEHIPRPWLAVKEITRILAINGICIITAPFIQTSHADPHDYFRFTFDGLLSLCKDEGLEVIEYGGYGRVAATLFDFIKMTWFSPYKKPMRGGRRVVNFLDRFGFWIDRIIRNNTIYGNSYIIARKINR